MFEARYNGSEDNYFAENAATVTTAQGVDAIDLPADFKEVVSLYLTGVGPVQLVSLQALRDAGYCGQDTPYLAALYPGNKLKLGPTPSGAFPLEVVYDAKVTPLTQPSDTNWLLTEYPFLYVYGSLMFMLSFLQDADRRAEIEGNYQQFIAELQGKKAAKKLGRTPQMRTRRGNP